MRGSTSPAGTSGQQGDGEETKEVVPLFKVELPSVIQGTRGMGEGRDEWEDGVWSVGESSKHRDEG